VGDKTAIGWTEAIQNTIDYIEGRSFGNYWDTRPGEDGRSAELPEPEAGQ
jgi:hypothetical protein